MKYDFDTVVDRRGTNSAKYDSALALKGREDLLPLWVADMDFRLPQEVLDDMTKTVNHGIFGYSSPKEGYDKAVHDWFQTQFGWDTQTSWRVTCPGVVFAIAMAIRAYTQPGDGVLVQQPVYYPFSSTVTGNGRKLVNNQLLYIDGEYSVDFHDFEEKIVAEQVKLFLLCSPHNPVGRVWRRAELERMGEICMRHGVVVLSDEIHSDFIYPGYTHHVFASLNDAFRDNCVICTAPSKTFNLAGLQASNIFIPNQELRDQFVRQRTTCGYGQINAMGIVATQSVYTKGRVWYEELKEYLTGNLAFATEFIQTRIPEIKVVQPQGTYLLWLDCNGLGLDDQALERFILDDAKLWLDGGGMFGDQTKQFQRVNFACPRSVLEQALVQLEGAAKSLR